MNVFFGTHKKKKKIKTIDNSKELFSTMKEYLQKNNLKSYYFRYIGIKDDETMIDYGSHTYFFFVDTNFKNLK